MAVRGNQGTNVTRISELWCGFLISGEADYNRAIERGNAYSHASPVATQAGITS